jgi:hypothetical protein
MNTARWRKASAVVTGDIKEQVQGKLDQAPGVAQDLCGQTADVAQDTAVTVQKLQRRTMKPSLCVGGGRARYVWLFGRMPVRFKARYASPFSEATDAVSRALDAGPLVCARPSWS